MIKLKNIIVLLSLFSVTALAQAPGNDGQMQQMQSRMQAMQEQMARIHETEDPAERQRLMQAHMESMHQGMMNMRRMMQGGTPPDSTPQCQNDDMQCKMNQLQAQQGMMGQQMNMMQQMMMQMMEQMTQGRSSETSDPENHEQHH